MEEQKSVQKPMEVQITDTITDKWWTEVMGCKEPFTCKELDKKWARYADIVNTVSAILNAIPYRIHDVKGIKVKDTEVELEVELDIDYRNSVLISVWLSGKKRHKVNIDMTYRVTGEDSINYETLVEALREQYQDDAEMENAFAREVLQFEKEHTYTREHKVRLDKKHVVEVDVWSEVEYYEDGIFTWEGFTLRARNVSSTIASELGKLLPALGFFYFTAQNFLK